MKSSRDSIVQGWKNKFQEHKLWTNLKKNCNERQQENHDKKGFGSDTNQY